LIVIRSPPFLYWPTADAQDTRPLPPKGEQSGFVAVEEGTSCKSPNARQSDDVQSQEILPSQVGIISSARPDEKFVSRNRTWSDDPNWLTAMLGAAASLWRFELL